MHALLVNGDSYIGSYFSMFIDDFIDVDIYNASSSLGYLTGKKYNYVFQFGSSDIIDKLSYDKLIYIPSNTMSGISTLNVEDFCLYLYRNMNSKGVIDADWNS